MDNNENVIVDFVFPSEKDEQVLNGKTYRLGKCSCGNDAFALASEMTADTVKGIPASRMFECTACGEYRLG